MDDRRFAELDAASQQVAQQEAAQDRRDDPLTEQVAGLARDLVGGIAGAFEQSPHAFWTGAEVARILHNVKDRL